MPSQCIELDDLLTRGRTVTNKYIKRFGKWSLFEQLEHINSEVKEFDEAISSDNQYNKLEEGCDIIYTVLTMFHLLGFTDKEIKDMLHNDLTKVEKRCEKRCEFGS